MSRRPARRSRWCKPTRRARSPWPTSTSIGSRAPTRRSSSDSMRRSTMGRRSSNGPRSSAIICRPTGSTWRCRSTASGGAHGSPHTARGRRERLSSEREVVKADFLAAHGFGGAGRQRLAGDASTRVYERLSLPGGGNLIFMDQPPQAETQPCPPEATPAERRALGYNAMARLAAGRVEAFVACAGYLRSLRLAAPEIIAADAALGLAVLEDLGDDLYATLIAAGDDETPLYDAAVDGLVRLHAKAPPARLQSDGAEWPLLTYDSLALQTGGEMFLEWWPKYADMPP